MRLLHLAVLGLSALVPSFAAEQINWYSNGFTSTAKPNLHSGSINFTSLGGKLIGANIDIDVLQGLQTPANANSIVTCFNCRLDFTSGTNLSDTSGSQWTFQSAGSSIAVRGGFDLNGNGVLDAADIQPGTVLLSGKFSSNVSVTTPVLGKPDLLLTAGILLNAVNTQLANFYGIPGGYQWSGDYSQTIDTTRPQFSPTGPGFHHYKIQSLAMRNGVLQDRLVVPEPGDVMLFGSVFAVLAGGLIVRRRRRAAPSRC